MGPSPSIGWLRGVRTRANQSRAAMPTASYAAFSIAPQLGATAVRAERGHERRGRGRPRQHDRPGIADAGAGHDDRHLVLAQPAGTPIARPVVCGAAAHRRRSLEVAAKVGLVGLHDPPRRRGRRGHQERHHLVPPAPRGLVVDLEAFPPPAALTTRRAWRRRTPATSRADACRPWRSASSH